MPRLLLMRREHTNTPQACIAVTLIAGRSHMLLHMRWGLITDRQAGVQISRLGALANRQTGARKLPGGPRGLGRQAAGQFACASKMVHFGDQDVSHFPCASTNAPPGLPRPIRAPCVGTDMCHTPPNLYRSRSPGPANLPTWRTAHTACCVSTLSIR